MQLVPAAPTIRAAYWVQQIDEHASPLPVRAIPFATPADLRAGKASDVEVTSAPGLTASGAAHELYFATNVLEYVKRELAGQA